MSSTPTAHTNEETICIEDCMRTEVSKCTPRMLVFGKKMMLPPDSGIVPTVLQPMSKFLRTFKVPGALAAWPSRTSPCTSSSLDFFLSFPGQLSFACTQCIDLRKLTELFPLRGVQTIAERSAQMEMGGKCLAYGYLRDSRERTQSKVENHGKCSCQELRIKTIDQWLHLLY